MYKLLMDSARLDEERTAAKANKGKFMVCTYASYNRDALYFGSEYCRLLGTQGISSDDADRESKPRSRYDEDVAAEEAQRAAAKGKRGSVSGGSAHARRASTSAPPVEEEEETVVATVKKSGTKKAAVAKSKTQVFLVHISPSLSLSLLSLSLCFR